MSDVTDLDYCDKCERYFASLEVHNDFWHKDEFVSNPLADKWDTSKFVLVMKIKYKTGKWWTRVFGPYDSRNKAMSHKRYIIRKMKEDYRSQEWIKENTEFTTTTIWTQNK